MEKRYLAGAAAALVACVAAVLPLTGGSSSSNPAGVPADAKTCSAGLYANSVTTCPFASNVAADYERSGAHFTSHSPVTGQDYPIDCTGVDVVTCTGATNATVYIVY